MTAPVKDHTEAPNRPLGPHPGAEPRANPAVRWITVVLGVLLIALSGVLVRELWFYAQDQPFTSWLLPVFNTMASSLIDAKVVTLGIIIALVGLWFVITAFIPRARTHVRVDSPASIWVRPVDIARKATNAARAETGSTTVRSKANRKKLTVEVDDDGTGSTQERVTSLLNGEFSRLQAPPAVAVKVNQPAPAPETATTEQEVQR
ncbi:MULTISPECIES: Asp23/Gls24 family envelope stress response protein [Corynebacterium]|uniref:Uncharacterized protein n=1 Tax=Corynebacterium riegelii TaxID=156976 RepID=A0A0K1RCL1_9CORY|nr:MULTISPECIES: hypothetical protein [Corynebacterium]AKV59138.1 hypothetical protein AK829_08150 [Corynebacterium riegelii]MDK7179689.1 hypothetical protein [Corynebacterium riegelii]OFT77542.1 hypothetical protein HMPREF3104_02155 [Corynebacterium sp. HMSC30G07]PLA14991.1 hypothetical protein CYJ48_01505 [Corynebacterium riegelii]